MLHATDFQRTAATPRTATQEALALLAGLLTAVLLIVLTQGSDVPEYDGDDWRGNSARIAPR